MTVRFPATGHKSRQRTQAKDAHAPGPHVRAFAGLTVQWLIFPDSVKDDPEEEARRRAAAEAAGPQLPKVGITSKPEDVRAAFLLAEKQGKALATSSGSDRGASSASGSGSDADTAADVSLVGRSTLLSGADSFLEPPPAEPPAPLPSSPFSRQDRVDGGIDLASRL